MKVRTTKQLEEWSFSTNSDSILSVSRNSNNGRMDAPTNIRGDALTKVKRTRPIRPKTHALLFCVSKLSHQLSKKMQVIKKSDMLNIKVMLGNYTDAYENKDLETIWRILNQDIKKHHVIEYHKAMEGSYHESEYGVGTSDIEKEKAMIRKLEFKKMVVDSETAATRAELLRIKEYSKMADLAMKIHKLKKAGARVPQKLSRVVNDWYVMDEGVDDGNSSVEESSLESVGTEDARPHEITVNARRMNKVPFVGVDDEKC
uniref:Uncharacterized protein n=3 Tax=Meloidogyne TaxID=189290 RepID=A0A6V7VD22_MELEN|nr:unnamed protein product [Meloidogyne enterolobii]